MFAEQKTDLTLLLVSAYTPNANLNLCTIMSNPVHFASVSVQADMDRERDMGGGGGREGALLGIDCDSCMLSEQSFEFLSFFFSKLNDTIDLYSPDTAPVKVLCNSKPPVSPPA